MKQKIEKSEMEKIIMESKSFREVIVKCGLSPKGSMAYQNVRNKILKLGLEVPKYNFYGDPNNKNRYLNNEVFIENSTYGRDKLKKRIIKQKLIPYECSKCKNFGMWNNNKLVLHLDHTNGINNDNRLENLRFLCPNCHSQTNTYAGKNNLLKNNINLNDKIKPKSRPHKKDTCKCGKQKLVISNQCLECTKKIIYENRPDINILQQEIKNVGIKNVAMKHNVSCSSIRNWIKIFKI